MAIYLLVFGPFEAGIFVEGPVVFGRGVVDGRLQDGFRLDAGE